jgi:hypothetical protein
VNKETPLLHDPGCRCMACASGQRNRFFKGKMMKAPEFEMEQRYGIERRRMLTRAISGWGIVHGLAVKGSNEEQIPFPESREFCVSAGLAVDVHGREILLLSDSVLGADNTFVIGPDCELQSLERIKPGDYVLAAHYSERFLGDTPLADDCCGTKTVENYVCETVLFSLRRLCEEECPCAEQDCPKGCRCHEHHCECGKRSRGSCLCDWSAKFEPPECATKPCRWREQDVWVHDGVDLACVHISDPAQNCRPPKGRICDGCSPRRILKSNDLLYNLIRGCDLTRIACLSWGKWHRRESPVPWEEFLRRLRGREEHGVLVTGLTVHFTGPVLAETVRPDCFALLFLEGRGEMHTRSVEITRVLTSLHDGDPAGTTRHATLCVRPEWYEDFTSHGSRVRKHGAHVRIEVNGYFILDCHHQPIDAGARGFALQEEDESVEPGGTGNPGGLLISVFKVARAPNGRPEYTDEEHNSGEEAHLYDESR